MSVIPAVCLEMSYASTLRGCTESSRMRHGRSLCPSMTGDAFSTRSARAMFGSEEDTALEVCAPADSADAKAEAASIETANFASAELGNARIYRRGWWEKSGAR